MSFEAAHARVIDLIEGVSPTTTIHLPADAAFRHAPEGRTGKPLSSRSFWLESIVDDELTFRGPYTPNLDGQPHMQSTVTAIFHYRSAAARRSELDLQIVNDMRDVMMTLGRPDIVGSQAMYSIDFITDLRAKRSTTDDGDAEVRLSFRMDWV